MQPAHIAIILVDYNTHKQTVACLRSLKKAKTTSDFEYSVFVVDNGSQDQLKLPQDLARRVQIVRSQANLGFTGGNNLGIWYAKEHIQPTHFLLLNNDTTVAADFLVKLFQKLSANPQLGAISPKIYFSAGHEFHKKSYSKHDLGNVLWYAGGSIDWQHLSAFHRGVDEVDRGQFDEQSQTDFCTGCCILVSRQVLEEVGTLDKAYFLYLEDVDLSRRIMAAGYQLAFCPESKVWHDNAGSGGVNSPTQQYYQTRNRLYFVWQHGSWAAKLQAFRILLQDLVRGTVYQRKAIFDLILGKMGKQPLH